MNIVIALCESPRIHALAAIPMLGYALALVTAAIQGQIQARGLLTILYLVCVSMAVLVAIRQEAEKDRQRKARYRAENKLEQLSETVDELQATHRRTVQEMTRLQTVVQGQVRKEDVNHG
jgi:hypothetical protein